MHSILIVKGEVLIVSIVARLLIQLMTSQKPLGSYYCITMDEEISHSNKKILKSCFSCDEWKYGKAFFALVVEHLPLGLQTDETITACLIHRPARTMSLACYSWYSDDKQSLPASRQHQSLAFHTASTGTSTYPQIRSNSLQYCYLRNCQDI